MSKIADIEGIGPAYAAKLEAAGVKNTDQLLETGKTPKGREELAEKCGVSSKLILEWVNHVDLARIKGIGWEYSDLLEEAGVDTVPELSHRNAANLYKKIVELNENKKLVRKLPTENQLTDWIEQAKELPRMITY